MNKKKVLFIINPISGGKNKDFLPSLIDKYIDKNKLDHKIVFTQHKGHAVELSGEGEFDYYIAAGGDGTLNEVASKLVHSNACMGILPLGSGNGLARHMGINMNVKKAIQQLNTSKTVQIDTCSFNGKPFVNMAGIGFDAHIGKMFAESTERGFKTYVIQTLTEFKNYQPQLYSLEYEGGNATENAFLVSFANSSQYGNNAFIAPNANIQDGMMEICILKPFKVSNLLSIGFRLFNKSIDKSKFLRTIRTNSVTINREKAGVAHLDGEPMDFDTTLTIRVIPSSLKLLVPS